MRPGADPDGIEFNRDSIEVSRIKEDADYEGVRVQFHATLARARIPMQLDIGFGDVITPGPTITSGLAPKPSGTIRRRERLGGSLNYYYRRRLDARLSPDPRRDISIFGPYGTAVLVLPTPTAPTVLPGADWSPYRLTVSSFLFLFPSPLAAPNNRNAKATRVIGAGSGVTVAL